MVQAVWRLAMAVCAGILVLPANAYADVDHADRVLHFDQPQAGLKSPRYKQSPELKPDENDFELLDVSFMSNNLGERWAVVTLKNTSTGQRLFRKQNIVATFADGSQSYALEAEETFKGREIITLSIFFGIRQFPLVGVRVD
jgi:hypothetical protein